MLPVEEVEALARRMDPDATPWKIQARDRMHVHAHTHVHHMHVRARIRTDAHCVHTRARTHVRVRTSLVPPRPHLTRVTHMSRRPLDSVAIELHETKPVCM